jgi:starvation-inducible DNA-binding protein
MHPTRNDLSTKTRAKVVAVLNARLAEGRAHLEALAGALARFGKSVRKAVDETGKAGDAGTSDLFTGISRSADKSLWLIEAHLQADR